MPSPSLIYGIHAVQEALFSGASIEKIWIRKEGEKHARLGEVLKLARAQQIPVQGVPEAKLRSLCKGEVQHQGVVAKVSEITYAELETVILAALESEGPALFVLLDGVTDVRNFGAMARTAEGLGAKGIIIGRQRSAPVNATAMKAAAGAFHHLPVCRVPHLVDAVMLLQAYEIPCIACTEKADASLFTADLSGPVCVVMGAEDTGISSSLLKRCDTQVHIPMYGNIGSFNVSVACGIILAEIVRQRNIK